MHAKSYKYNNNTISVLTISRLENKTIIGRNTPQKKEE